MGVDVLVAGGGLAGCAAAIAAARNGLRVLLVERGSYLGGNATRGMVAPWQSYHASWAGASPVNLQETDGSQSGERGRAVLHEGSNAQGHNLTGGAPALPVQVIGGIAQEFVDDLVASGASLGHIVDPIGFAGSLTPVDAEALKLYLPQKVAGAGVEVQLATSVTQEHIAAARFVVDATGQAYAAQLIGAPVAKARELQPMTWMFTMGDVDIAKIRELQLTQPDQFVLHPNMRELREDFIAVSGFFDIVKGARESGELDIPRDRLLFFSTPRAGEVLVNTTRIPADHPHPRLEGLRQVALLAEWLPRSVPGFEHARLGRIADDIGERESSRLVGRYALSVDDLSSGRRFDDAVARGCYPIDIHSASSDELNTRELGGQGWYDIPLRCLQAPNIENLLVAGRCISADASGFASARTLPTAMATGQAAGMVAAMLLRGEEIDYAACISAIALV
jgi:hypothetical protein